MIHKLYESEYLYAKFDLQFQKITLRVLESLARGVDFGNFVLGADVKQFPLPAIKESILHVALEMRHSFDDPIRFQEYIQNMFKVGQVGGTKVTLVGEIKFTDNLAWTERAARDWLEESTNEITK